MHTNASRRRDVTCRRSTDKRDGCPTTHDLDAERTPLARAPSAGRGKNLIHTVSKLQSTIIHSNMT